MQMNSQFPLSLKTLFVRIFLGILLSFNAGSLPVAQAQETVSDIQASSLRVTSTIPISAEISAMSNLPSKVDLSSGMPSVREQSGDDCTAWAVAYYYKSFQEKRSYNWEYNDAHTFSPSYIYNQHDFSSGGPYSSEYAFQDLVSQGVASQAMFPYDPSGLVQPSQAARNEAASYKAESYQKIYDPNNSNGFAAVDSLKAHLATGDPFVMDIPLYGTGLPINGPWNALIPLHVPTVIDIPSASVFQIYRGGHAVTVVGYDDATQRFKFINSWGTDWGIGGFGYISYGFVIESFPYGAYAMTDKILPPVGPRPPSNLSANAVSSSQIDLSWNGSPDSVDGYRIWSGGAIVADKVTTTSYSFSGLSSCSTYSFYITAYKGDLASSSSNTSSAKTSGCLSGAPSAPSLNSPSNGQVFPRFGDINLVWNSNGSYRYLVEFWGGPDGGKSNLPWQSGTSLFFGNGNWGGNYSWHVKAQNSSGQASDWGETRTFFKKYGTPGNVGVSALSATQARLTWSASADAPGNIEGYRIYRDGQLRSFVGSGATSFDDYGLNCNSSYSYYLIAYRGSGESDASSTVSVTTNGCPPPTPSAYWDAWPLSGSAPFTTALHIVDMSNITNCSWNYGDGQTSTTCTQLHNHVYNNSGSYTISLTVSGPGGSANMARTDYITVTNSNNQTLTISKSGTGNGTVVSSPVGINCGTTCSYAFAYNTVVTLTATPIIGSTFTGWNGGGCSGTSTCTVPMNTVQAVTATFNSSSPSGYFDNFSTYPPGAPPTGWLLRGTDGITPIIEEIAGSGPDYRLISFPEVSWQYWDKWLLKSNLYLSGNYSVKVKMNFQNSVADRAGLTIAWDDSNWNRIDIQPNVYGDDIEFRVSYTGSLPSNLNVTNVGYISINAFTDYWMRVDIVDNGPGQGQVRVFWSTDGVNFAQVITATGLATVSGLAGVSTAGPHMPHMHFDDFSIVLNPPNNQMLTIAKSGMGSGTVTSNPVGINCGSDCSESYAYNKIVTLTATPSTNSTFTGWSGGGCSGTGICTVTMTTSSIVIATFTLMSVPSQTFADVPPSHPYYTDIEILYASGLTGGCSTSPLKFCPDDIMDRGQAAVFMVRGKFGSGFFPPPATHIFKDDWTKGSWAESWAEGMFYNGLSAGCQASPRMFCPWDKMPREQAVIFALRMKYGTSYIPPAATGTLFADLTDVNYYATSWAEQAYRDGLIPSCGASGGKPKICPKSLVSRGLGAYMIVRAKNLSMP